MEEKIYKKENPMREMIFNPKMEDEIWCLGTRKKKSEYTLRGRNRTDHTKFVCKKRKKQQM
jgi:hypothetical protein